MPTGKRFILLLAALVIAPVVLFAATPASAPSKGSGYMVPMSDGVQLATSVFLPPGKGPWPVLLYRTPYGRGQMGFLVGVFNTVRGIAVVFQDVRGRFDSQGENWPFVGCGWADHQDGVDTIAWIRKQPWCNGKVGTAGSSALGITQNLLAPTAPQGLCAQYIDMAAANLYADGVYVGGATRKDLMDWVTACSFDSNAAEAWKEHDRYDEYWAKFDTTKKFASITSPAVHVGGWFDIFCQGTINSFVGRQHHGGEGAKGKQMLVMGPWTHDGVQGDLDFRNADPPSEYDETRWFDYWLRGKDNGMMKEPAVAYYVMGDVQTPGAPSNQWRYRDDWPPPSKQTPLFFRKDGTLTLDSCGGSAGDFMEYRFDPNDPCPTIGGRNLGIPAGPRDQKPLIERKDVLSFATGPLGEPLEITGSLAARIFISSSAVDTDVSVLFCDEYPDGKCYKIADGILRLRCRNSMSKQEALEPGRIYEVKVDCWSTSIIFNKGHRIRVLVTSSDHPKFDVNPGTGKSWDDNAPRVTQVNRLYCDANYPSAMLLPVAKGESR